jgi:hypothetical protein
MDISGYPSTSTPFSSDESRYWLTAAHPAGLGVAEKT